MSTDVDTAVEYRRAVADRLISFLETGEVAAGLFAEHVFCDFWMPTWRLQAQGRDAAVALRRGGHPFPGRVSRQRFDPTPTGFVLEVQEEWDNADETWRCGELFRADVTEQGIIDLAVFCTGDWDQARIAEHTAAVPMIRP